MGCRQQRSDCDNRSETSQTKKEHQVAQAEVIAMTVTQGETIGRFGEVVPGAPSVQPRRIQTCGRFATAQANSGQCATCPFSRCQINSGHASPRSPGNLPSRQD